MSFHSWARISLHHFTTSFHFVQDNCDRMRFQSHFFQRHARSTRRSTKIERSLSSFAMCGKSMRSPSPHITAKLRIRTWAALCVPCFVTRPCRNWEASYSPRNVLLPDLPDVHKDWIVSKAATNRQVTIVAASST